MCDATCMVHIAVHLYTQPRTMELVEGYGVFITQRQLDECVSQSCGFPTRLLRNLLMVYFTPAVLGSSSCLGTRNFTALNPEVTGACFSKLKIKDKKILTFIMPLSLPLPTHTQNLYSLNILFPGPG